MCGWGRHRSVTSNPCRLGYHPVQVAHTCQCVVIICVSQHGLVVYHKVPIWTNLHSTLATVRINLTDHRGIRHTLLQGGPSSRKGTSAVTWPNGTTVRPTRG
jgi:hypothetical protein